MDSVGSNQIAGNRSLIESNSSRKAVVVSKERVDSIAPTAVISSKGSKDRIESIIDMQ